MAKLPENVMSQILLHLIDTKVPIFVNDFFVRSKLECNTNRISKGRALCELLYYANGTLDNAPNRRMCAVEKSKTITVSVHSNGARSPIRLRLYPEAFNYFFKKLLTDRAISELRVVIIRYMQLSNMTTHQNDMAQSLNILDCWRIWRRNLKWQFGQRSRCHCSPLAATLVGTEVKGGPTWLRFPDRIPALPSKKKAVPCRRTNAMLAHLNHSIANPGTAAIAQITQVYALYILLGVQNENQNHHSFHRLISQMEPTRSA